MPRIRAQLLLCVNTLPQKFIEQDLIPSTGAYSPLLRILKTTIFRPGRVSIAQQRSIL